MRVFKRSRDGVAPKYPHSEVRAVPSVLYVVNDKLGGVLSLNSNLARFHEPDGFSHDFLLLHDRSGKDARWNRPAGGDRERTFEYASSVENLYAVLRRLRSKIPGGDEGVLVANDWLELALATEYDLGRAVVQIVHDEYHLGLALRHEPVVDAFVAHSLEYYERLRTALPERIASIHYLPYGIPIPTATRQANPGPLRLLFIGRMTRDKGIFDLPEIDRRIAEAGVSVSWTLAGDGPEKSSLQAHWKPRSPDAVKYVTPENNEAMLTLAAEHDVFVLPTRFEGFPVSLLETMASGLVPVVSDLPGGIAEVVKEGTTGYRPRAGAEEEFAKTILELDADRERLETMGSACRKLVIQQFDIHERVRGYQALFAEWRALRRDRAPALRLPYGSRLDKPWLPNGLVRLFRFSSRRLRGQAAVW